MGPTGLSSPCSSWPAELTRLRRQAQLWAFGWSLAQGSPDCAPAGPPIPRAWRRRFCWAATGLLDNRLLGVVSPNCGTTSAVAGAAATLTLAAPSAGLPHYLNRIAIERHAAAALTAGATLTLVTSTNLPGSVAFSIPVEAAVAGSIYKKIVDPARPMMFSAQNIAVAIIAGADPSVIWRVTALFYFAW